MIGAALGSPVPGHPGPVYHSSGVGILSVHWGLACGDGHPAAVCVSSRGASMTAVIYRPWCPDGQRRAQTGLVKLGHAILAALGRPSVQGAGPYTLNLDP